MPGRKISLSDYRFGFNTQEKVDEFSGLGNHTTALFWEYDTRLLRRWNIDPVKKSWQSDYGCFSLSPLWRIDPNGDDDFFKSDGSLSHRTNTGTKIFVQTKDGNKTFSQIQTNSMHNRQVLANVVTFYAGLVGIQGMVGIANHQDEKNKDGTIDKHLSDKTLAYTEGDNIYVNAKGGEINDLLDDYNNLESALIHEKDHKTKGHGEKPASHTEHAEVYINQIGDPSFKNTTDDYKNGTIGSLIDELEKASIDDQVQDNDIKGLVDRANQALANTDYSISFKRKINDSYGIEFNSHKKETKK